MIVVNLMKNSSNVAMKCQFIKNTYARTLATEIYKSLADINPDFMKPYFMIKKRLIIYELDAP